MSHSVKNVDIVWGYLSQFLNIASSLLLLPFVLKFLDKEELGLWYVFIAMAGLIQLLEFGLLPSISRFVSYVYSGAKKINYNEIPQCEKDIIDYSLLNDVFYASKYIYKKIAIISIAAIFIGGNYYLYTLHSDVDYTWLAACWTLYGVSIAVQLYFGYYNSLLKGRGDQTALNKIIVATKSVLLLSAIPMLILGFGIFSLAVSSFLSIIVDRVLVRRAVFKKDCMLNKKNVITDEQKVLRKNIWLSAKDMGFVQLGNYLTVRSGILVVSSFVGLDAAATYGLTVQITMVMVIIASMFFGLNLPRLNSEQVLKNTLVVKNIFLKSIFVANIIYIFSAFILLIAGDFLLSYLTESTRLLPFWILLIYLMTALFEMNYSLCTTYLTTKNKVIFLKSILLSGLAILLLSLFSASVMNAGLLGVVLSQLVVQMAYNNWRWPLEVYKDFKNV
ncbi:O-unit flippase-like protein [Erwinia sp. Eh17-17]|uniref:O-unit flippase-like protein n=1 Tax=Erwinia sp. Eh17-17 TaxID=3080330 RepID=UPI003209CA0F